MSIGGFSACAVATSRGFSRFFLGGGWFAMLYLRGMCIHMQLQAKFGKHVFTTTLINESALARTSQTFFMWSRGFFLRCNIWISVKIVFLITNARLVVLPKIVGGPPRQFWTPGVLWQKSKGLSVYDPGVSLSLLQGSFWRGKGVFFSRFSFWSWWTRI